nr:glycosyltransferase [Desulfobacterales bacterium]
MTKILYVIDNLSFGGGERCFAQVIRSLPQDRYKIFAACKDQGIFWERLKEYMVIGYSVDMTSRFDLPIIRYLATVMKKEKVQIVHSQGARADFFARVAARLTEVPFVVSTVAMPVEGYDIGPLRKAVYLTFDRLTERFVDRFIVVSEALRRSLIEKHRIPPEKIVRIYNGIELDKYDPERYSGEKVRRKLKIGSDVPLVGAIGRLVWQKGFPFFIRAASYVLRAVPEAKFLLVGDGPLRSELEGMVRDLGMRENFIFTGFRRDVPEVLAALDVLVLSSLREGLPMILLEGMAMTRPVVATDIEGISEVVEHERTGILVPPQVPRALADGIIALLRDRDKARLMGEAGRRRVEERFSVEEMVRRTQEVYETMVGNSRF